MTSSPVGITGRGLSSGRSFRAYCSHPPLKGWASARYGVRDAISGRFDEVQSREAERIARIVELQERLDEVLDKKAKLEAALEEERARRQELETKLKRKPESDDSLFGWF